jgi:outer membrane protein OmpA-like peptidoglycan-associated protein
LTYFVSLSERSDFAVTEFDALFTTLPISIRTKKQLSKKYWMGESGRYHFIEGSREIFYSDIENWQEIRKTFKATGAERYLILGNFNSNRETRVKETGIASNKGAYYYLDNLALTATEQYSISELYPLDSLIILPNLLFDFDDAQLTAVGKSEMRKVYDFLSSDSTLNLEVRGHTDAIGTGAYNQKLSNDRCMVVVQYLIGLGLPHKRIIWKGYGSQKPRSDNTTPEGRMQNRRVEFRFFVPIPEEP